MTPREAFDLFWRTRPDPSIGPRAVVLALTVAHHETGFAGGWGRSCPEMVGSWNFGAIQGSPGAVCGDSHADGSKYRATYRIYPSAEAGAAGLWHELWRRELVRRVLRDDSLDTDGLAAAMRASGYYEATLKSYKTALRDSLKSIEAGL